MKTKQTDDFLGWTEASHDEWFARNRNATAQTLPVVHCLAQLETVIRESACNGSLATGPVATFADGTEVHVTGKIRLKGMFSTIAVRWQCPANGNKGLFGKGYVEVKPFTLSNGYWELPRVSDQANEARLADLPATA